MRGGGVALAGSSARLIAKVHGFAANSASRLTSNIAASVRACFVSSDNAMMRVAPTLTSALLQILTAEVISIYQTVLKCTCLNVTLSAGFASWH